MAFKLQRGPILPQGRYWQNFTDRNVDQALAWLATQEKAGRCRYVASEGDPTGKETFWILWDVPAGKTMPWAELEFGAPTIASSSVTKRSDVDANPAPEPLFDTSIFTGFALAGLAPLALFLGAAWILGQAASGGSGRRARR